jgi:hypothetical protein
MGIDKEENSTYTEFMQQFLAKHAIVGPGSGKVTVILTKDELMNLARGIVQVFVGWGAGLEVLRLRGEALPEYTAVSVDIAENERPLLALVHESKTDSGGTADECENNGYSNVTGSKRKVRHHR